MPKELVYLGCCHQHAWTFPPIPGAARDRRRHESTATLSLATVDDSRGVIGILVLARAGAGALNLLDDFHALGVCYLAKDNVLAIEPGGHNSSNEELGAVAGISDVSLCASTEVEGMFPRVRTSIGH